MSTRVKANMFCPRCQTPVMAQRTGHAVRNSIGALATLGLSIKTEPWACPNCGTECTDAAAPTYRSSRRKQKGQQWRCEKNLHLMDRRRTHCPIDGSACGWHFPREKAPDH